jgi:hypothetical protein
MAGVPGRSKGLHCLQTEKSEMQREATHSVTDDKDHGVPCEVIHKR